MKPRPRTRPVLAFTALVGQEQMKSALVLNAINPQIGGVLIRGEKGTAKSTAVRALARLLPDLDVTVGCRFFCDPNDALHRCVECQSRLTVGEELEAFSLPMAVVELPVNASEDRLVGSIDIEVAMREGKRRFEPGVLASANRNLLYVDEVNLLDDHLVDVLLDAAAMGRNIVEREGISFEHPAQLMLVGTMNPEEGALRPQLLDRFGLCVDVRGLRAIPDRVAVIERSEDPTTETHLDNDARLRSVIAMARELLPLVTLLAPMRQLIALICLDAGVVGHRADLVIARTARTLCAQREAEHVVDHDVLGAERERPVDALTVQAADVVAAAELALAHRRTEPSGSDRRQDESVEQAAQRHLDEMAERESEPTDTEAEVGQDQSEDDPSDTPSQESEPTAEQSDQDSAGGSAGNESASESAFVGELFNVRKIGLPRDHRQRARSGKRSVVQSADRRGRYVRSIQTEHTTDVALDATLRAAAPHQSKRRSQPGASDAAVHVERQDLRQKVRRRKTGTLIVFVVDASASMDAEQRMLATKGAVLSLLRDAYVRRDKVSLVVFSGRTARVVLAPTSSVDLATTRLQRLGVGGTTPLTHGLVAGLKIIRTERLRDASILPLLVLISDGRGNISLFGDEPLVEAQRVAEQIGAEGVRMLVIDSARDYTGKATPALPRVPGAAALFGTAYAVNACQDLADRSGGDYLGLYDLSQRAIVAGVQRTLRAG